MTEETTNPVSALSLRNYTNGSESFSAHRTDAGNLYLLQGIRDILLTAEEVVEFRAWLAKAFP